MLAIDLFMLCLEDGGGEVSITGYSCLISLSLLTTSLLGEFFLFDTVLLLVSIELIHILFGEHTIELKLKYLVHRLNGQIRGIVPQQAIH